MSYSDVNRTFNVASTIGMRRYSVDGNWRVNGASTLIPFTCDPEHTDSKNSAVAYCRVFNGTYYFHSSTATYYTQDFQKLQIFPRQTHYFCTYGDIFFRVNELGHVSKCNEIIFSSWIKRPQVAFIDNFVIISPRLPVIASTSDINRVSRGESVHNTINHYTENR